MPVAHSMRRRLLRLGIVIGSLALIVPLTGGAPAAKADGGVSTGDTVVGKLTRAWSEDQNPIAEAKRGKDALLTFVHAANGDSVRVPTQQVQKIPEGSTVAVKVGTQVVDTATTQDGFEPARQVVSASVVAPAPAPSGSAPSGTAPAGTAPAATPPYTDDVTVVMTVPQGVSQDQTPITLQQVVDQVNGPVADFWQAQSNGAIRLDVTGQQDWFNATVGCSDPYALWDQAAQQANWTPGPGKHLMVYLPYDANNHGCAYGLAEVGASLHGGGELYVTDLVTSVMAHELGHNFGLEHSSLEQCDRSVDSGACSTTSYYDLYDVMGASWDQLGSLNVAQAAHLGFLPAGQQQTLTETDASTTVTLSPVSGTSGIRGIELSAPDGSTYWLEYRPAAGQDGYLADLSLGLHGRDWPGLEPGVLVRRWTNAGDDPGDGALLEDASPSAQAGWGSDTRQAMPLNTPVRVAGGVFTVTVSAEGSDATVNVVPGSPITAVHDAAGGDSGALGAATGAETCATGFCSRTYQNGVVDWSIRTGAHAVTDPVLTAWSGLGGTSGWLGLPTADVTCGLAQSGCMQTFQGGAEYWSPATGAHAVNGALRAVWNATGAQGGWLGYPTSDATCGLARGGCVQTFQTGSEYWSPSSGAHPVNGALRTTWNATGAEAGWLGYPTSDAICGLTRGGCLQIFQTGVEYWSPASGTHPINGALRSAWAATGSEAGWLGYPTSDAICGLARGGCLQVFQGGVEYWSSGSGAHAVNGALRSAWGATGFENGWLAYPTSDAICGLVRGGCFQVFQGGVEYWSPGSGTHAVNGAIRAAWGLSGSENGWLGYPVTDAGCDGSGCIQGFQGARLYWSSATGRVTPR